jgi:hypothetical protein
MLLTIAVIIAAGIVFLIYANLSNQAETSRVNAAIKRDCLIDLVVEPNEIGEPGVVFKSYEVNGIPMELVCQGPNWTCRCSVRKGSTPTPINNG